MKLIESLTLIDTAIQADYPYSIRTFGLCYLQEKDGKTAPLQNLGGAQGKRVQWDDTDALRTYHRILSSNEITDPSAGFGKSPRKFTIFQMRLVGIGTRKLLTTQDYEQNQEVCQDIKDLIPVWLAPGCVATLTESEVNKLTVYESEFAGLDMKKLSLEGVAFWINYELKLINC
jgi:hypothetical protein